MGDKKILPCGEPDVESVSIHARFGMVTAITESDGYGESVKLSSVRNSDPWPSLKGKEGSMERFLVWFRNSLSFHHRLMANFLRKRGWVAFYLEEEARNCNNGICWLKLYQQEMK